MYSSSLVITPIVSCSRADLVLLFLKHTIGLLSSSPGTELAAVASCCTIGLCLFSNYTMDFYFLNVHLW